jgi:uncharacterized CHY-type Zn-finger protein
MGKDRKGFVEQPQQRVFCCDQCKKNITITFVFWGKGMEKCPFCFTEMQDGYKVHYYRHTQ